MSFSALTPTLRVNPTDTLRERVESLFAERPVGKEKQATSPPTPSSPLLLPSLHSFLPNL